MEQRKVRIVVEILKDDLVAEKPEEVIRKLVDAAVQGTGNVPDTEINVCIRN